MGFRVIDYIQRKSAGMYALCVNWSETLRDETKANAKWKDRTGHARQAIHGEVEVQNNEYTIYTSHGVQYGEYLENGTPPHIIRPKNKKALYWKGVAHPVKQVNHPGTKGFNTIENTMLENKERIKNTIIDYWSD